MDSRGGRFVAVDAPDDERRRKRAVPALQPADAIAHERTPANTRELHEPGCAVCSSVV